jgi:hypothetical protein
MNWRRLKHVGGLVTCMWKRVFNTCAFVGDNYWIVLLCTDMITVKILELPYNMNQQDALFSVNFNSKPLHVSSRLVAHHQEDQLCRNSSWCSHALCWLAAASSQSTQRSTTPTAVYTELILLMMTNKPAQQPVNTTLDYTNCCLYRVDPPDDEQQTCSAASQHNARLHQLLFIQSWSSRWWAASLLETCRGLLLK